MHELTLALAIVEMAVSEAEKNHAGPIGEIEIEVGSLSGVDADALEFVLPFAAMNTRLERTAVKMIRTEGKGWCPRCDRAFAMAEAWTQCPLCGTPAGKILSGEELRIVSMMVND